MEKLKNIFYSALDYNGGRSCRKCIANAISARTSPIVDKFWGLVGDAGVVLGKFGKDAKPLTDRIKDIMQIVWRAQSITEELPSDSPLPMLEDLYDKED